MIKCKNSCPLEKFEGCCVQCPDRETCEDVCEHAVNYTKCEDAVFDEEAGLVALEQQQMTVIKQIADICTAKKQLEAQEKELKDKLKAAMEQYGVKSLDNDILKITYIAATTANSIDSAKLKKLHPDIAAECTKTSAKSAYIKVEVKGGEK
jgi:predicted phage-related endonuclease